MKPNHTVFLALMLNGLSCAAAAGFTPAEVLDYQRAGDLHVSPDGKKLAFIVLRWTISRVSAFSMSRPAPRTRLPRKARASARRNGRPTARRSRSSPTAMAARRFI